MIWLLMLLLSYNGPYGYGFDPDPYPYIAWSGNLCDWVIGDFDFDGDVDQDDLEPFEMCTSGPGVMLPWPTYPDGHPSACWLCDFDNDWDVDQSDFGVLQRMM